MLDFSFSSTCPFVTFMDDPIFDYVASTFVVVIQVMLVLEVTLKRTGDTYLHGCFSCFECLSMTFSRSATVKFEELLSSQAQAILISICYLSRKREALNAEPLAGKLAGTLLFFYLTLFTGDTVQALIGLYCFSYFCLSFGSFESFFTTDVTMGTLLEL